MFRFKNTPIDDVFEIEMPYHNDERGAFTKIFQMTLFQNSGIFFDLKESYFSRSEQNVIRGMHFQMPPYHHHKIVYCPYGSIMDVALDLRKKSTTYGRYIHTVLSAENHTALFIPKGCAHGFKALTKDALTAYLVSSEYQSDADTGILWDSFGLDWQCQNPVISKRDKTFPAFSEFETPF